MTQSWPTSSTNMLSCNHQAPFPTTKKHQLNFVSIHSTNPIVDTLQKLFSWIQSGCDLLGNSCNGGSEWSFSFLGMIVQGWRLRLSLRGRGVIRIFLSSFWGVLGLDIFTGVWEFTIWLIGSQGAHTDRKHKGVSYLRHKYHSAIGHLERGFH